MNMEFMEFSAKTVNDAVTEACKHFTVPSDKLEYEVIEEEKSGVFGLFSKPARIRVRKKEQVVDRVYDFLKRTFDAMHIDVAISHEMDEIESTLSIELKGNDMGMLIGKRGQTLDSLQYLTSLVANKNSDKYVKIKIDTENYRQRRKETIENLAKNMANKVKKTGRPAFLEPMNPYERRIIHTSVQKVNGAISWSEGENANRHVVIGPDPKAKPVRRNGGYNNRGRGGRRPYSANRSEHNTPANPDRKPLNEGGATGLYGRIDK